MSDEFWMNAVRRSGSNSATAGFADLEDIIDGGQLTVRQLRAMGGALRSISQKAYDRASRIEAVAKRPWEQKAEGR